MQKVKITVDSKSGFCFGVVYAIEMAESILKDENKLYCLGDIVHNNREVDRLNDMGLEIIDHQKLRELSNCKVLIRAHGEPPSTYEIALKNNIELLDASCPVVLKLQHQIKEGYETIKDIDGQIRILNRKGKDRIRVKKIDNISNNDVFGYRNTFSTTSKKGDLLQIDSNGNIVESPLGLRSDHKIDMTSKSIVTFSENKLNIKGIPVILPFGKYSSPKIHYINNTIYVTITDLDSQKVYCFYSNGTLLGGFPVYGLSLIHI